MPLWNLPGSDLLCSEASAMHGDIAKSTGAGVQDAMGGIDASDLRASFRRALSFSTPPLTLYHNYRPSGYSKLIFGVPLEDHRISEDNVPKVIRMCIEEVEKRGLHVDNIYSVSLLSNHVFGFTLSVPVGVHT
jgi:hypothetical protein